MHQQTTDRVHPETPGHVLAAVDTIRHADRIGALPLIRKFRSALLNEDRSGHGNVTTACGLEMAGENVRFPSPVVREEPIGRLGVGPVLAGQRNA